MTYLPNLRIPCVHCGHEFTKNDTKFVALEGWRLHDECLYAVCNEEHPLKGCTSCFLKTAAKRNEKALKRLGGS